MKEKKTKTLSLRNRIKSIKQKSILSFPTKLQKRKILYYPEELRLRWKSDLERGNLNFPHPPQKKQQKDKHVKRLRKDENRMGDGNPEGRGLNYME